jgi:hypothetical protein
MQMYCLAAQRGEPRNSPQALFWIEQAKSSAASKIGVARGALPFLIEVKNVLEHAHT